MSIVKRVAVVGVSLAGLAGCTIAQLQHDVNEREMRIADKERDLQEEGNRRSALQQEQQQLVADLDSKQMSLNDLSRRLERLQAENRRSNAVTVEQRQRKQRLDEQISKHRLELAQLQKRDDVSSEEKKRRIEDLKREIKKQIELQLH